MQKRRLGSAVLTAVFLAAASVAPASAAPPDWRFAFDFDGEEETLCGMTARLDGFIHGIFRERERRDGTVLVTVNEHWSIRYTNVATGRWLLAEFNGASKDLDVVDEGSGIITVVGTVNGIERVYTPDGSLLAHAAGTTRREISIDLGDPEDPEDDVALSDQVIKRAGLRSGVADCEVIRAHLG